MLDTSKQNKKEQGSIMLITTIILLILTLIVVGALKLSNMQFNLSQMQRNTSNTYYVAEAGAEKAIETINKSIETKLPDIVKTASNVFLELDTSLSEGEQRHLVVNADQDTRKDQAVKTTHKYDEFQYATDKIQVNTHMYAEKKVNGSTMAEAPITFSQYVRYELFDYLLKYYFVKDNFYADSEYKTINAVGVSGVLATDPKPMVYEVEADKYGENYVTVVQVIPKAKKDTADPSRWNRNTFEIITVSRTVYKNADGSYDYSKVYDAEKVVTEVAIQIPSNLEHEFREYYEWIANPAEIVDNPITCFSDLIVDGTGNILQVIDGDVLVKGIKQISSGADAIADADKTGGVIASNGGTIELINSTVGGTFDPKKNANLYTLSNVVVTNGWGDTPGDSSKYNNNTSIDVQGDVIANAINIIDDFYKGSVNQTPFNDSFKGQNEFIKVGMNAFVDNDVMIDKWIKGTTTTASGKKVSSAGYIQVNGTIFGISNGSRTFVVTNPDSTTQLIVDPNSSSGVYSQGEDTLITADRMLIAGQPFITLSETAYPKKLFESIGEPFNGIASLDGYGENEAASAANDAYLKAGSPFINAAGGSDSINSKKVATNFATSYTMALASAIDSGEKASEGVSLSAIAAAKPGQSLNSAFSSKTELLNFMFQGKTSVPNAGGDKISIASYTSQDNRYGTITDDSDKEKTAYINSVPVDNFYSGTEDKAGYLKMYNKIFLESVPSAMTSYRGVQAYMTAMRGVFYGQFIVNGSTGEVTEQLLNFSDVVDVSKVPDNEWSYATPILARTFTLSDNVINIKDFYTEVSGSEQMQPTIIVNKGDKPIYIKATKEVKTPGVWRYYDTFKGIIISKGPVILNGEDVTELKMEGVIIVGGPEKAALTITNEGIYKTADNKGLSVKGKVTVTKGSDTLLLDIDPANRKVYRGVLDALRITKYAGSSTIAQALGEYDNGSTTKLRYTLGKVGYSNKTYLYMDTNQIYLKIQSQQKQ